MSAPTLSSNCALTNKTIVSFSYFSLKEPHLICSELSAESWTGPVTPEICWEAWHMLFTCNGWLSAVESILMIDTDGLVGVRQIQYDCLGLQIGAMVTFCNPHFWEVEHFVNAWVISIKSRACWRLEYCFPFCCI